MSTQQDPKLYYGARRVGESWNGIVYRYTEDGEREIRVFTSSPLPHEADAIDAASDWLEVSNLEAEMDW